MIKHEQDIAELLIKGKEELKRKERLQARIERANANWHIARMICIATIVAVGSFTIVILCDKAINTSTETRSDGSFRPRY